MRLGDGGDNFEDRTGHSGMSFGGGLGGGIFGMLLPLILSRFGIIGLLILGLGYCALTSLGGGGGGGLLGGGSGTSPATQGTSTITPEQRRVISGSVASTQQVWSEIFQQAGAQYTPPQLVAYTQGTR